jgi:DMSO/TMAO reductase YedYZ molybdopterin-dependent catalytic subunit
MATTRREFLTLAAAVTTLSSFPEARRTPIDGQLLGRVPLGRAGRQPPPLETVLGSGLNARLFTDLSRLKPTSLVTSNERFFVRTARPAALPPTRDWSIRVGGLVARPSAVLLTSLADVTRSVGTHFIECSGNADATNFGLMSEARWEGVPIAVFIDRVRPSPRGRHVLVSGVDDPDPTPTSLPGASWIFTRDDLERAGAFLATRMNGAPLPPDHGFPVRLVVPGWYGCVCIKWVNQIDFVDDDVMATSQMREFAARTHQEGSPALAREFTPALIDHAATPVRVEKWLTGRGLIYRIVGILWGGSRPTNALVIRFRRDEPFAPVDDCPRPDSTTRWTLWTHWWRPPAPGRYEIALRINDPTLRTRRLDRSFYAREVEIDEVQRQRKSSGPNVEDAWAFDGERMIS